MSLSESLEEAHLSAEMFLNNRFEEARNIVKPMWVFEDKSLAFTPEAKLVGLLSNKCLMIIYSRSDRSIYHSLGYSILIYLKAMMTTEEVWTLEKNQLKHFQINNQTS